MMRRAVELLTSDVMTLQAEGSYEKAEALVARLGVLRPEVQRALARLQDVPVDIEPQFKAAWAG
jgi:hypothetical protein